MSQCNIEPETFKKVKAINSGGMKILIKASPLKYKWMPLKQLKHIHVISKYQIRGMRINKSGLLPRERETQNKMCTFLIYHIPVLYMNNIN